MPISETQFRELLFERSAGQPVVTDRGSQVRARIVRRRNRHRLVAIGGVVAAAALVAAAVVVPLRVHSEAVDAGAGGSQQYFNGGELIANGRLDSPQQGSASITFTPTNWQLTLRVECKSPATKDATIEVASIQLNGHLALGGGCGSRLVGGASSSSHNGQDQQDWSAVGVRLGQPSTVTLTVGKGVAGVPSSALSVAERPSAVAVVEVYQRVPLNEYKFPKAPKRLAVLAPDGVAATPVLDSRALGANVSWTIPVTVAADSMWSVATVAPGSVSFAVDGHVVEVAESWDYNANGQQFTFGPDTFKAAGVNVSAGETVDVVVTASRFAGPDWVVYNNGARATP